MITETLITERKVQTETVAVSLCLKWFKLVIVTVKSGKVFLVHGRVTGLAWLPVIDRWTEGMIECLVQAEYNLYCVGADLKPCSINQSMEAM